MFIGIFIVFSFLVTLIIILKLVCKLIMKFESRGNNSDSTNIDDDERKIMAIDIAVKEFRKDRQLL